VSCRQLPGTQGGALGQACTLAVSGQGPTSHWPTEEAADSYQCTAQIDLWVKSCKSTWLFNLNQRS